MSDGAARAGDAAGPAAQRPKASANADAATTGLRETQQSRDGRDCIYYGGKIMVEKERTGKGAWLTTRGQGRGTSFLECPIMHAVAG
jgi:hypothetical protein